MPGLRLVTCSLLGIAMLDPGGLAAQRLEHRPFSPAAREVFSAPTQEAKTGGGDWHRHLLAGLSGAAVGAGLGFVASQILVGDWDEDAGSANRALWIGVGGGAGLAVGFAIGPPPRRPPGGAIPRWQREPERAVLTAEVIRESSARTAYEVIESRRPEWLGSISLKVYMDDVLLGGVEELHDVNAADVASIHRLNAAQATRRWGTGHANGAIVIVTFR